jgi:VanZ family protein
VSGVAWLAFTPNPPPQADTGWDKANHGLAFFTMGLAAARAWPGRGFARIAAALLAYGLLIEFVQAFVPGRSADAADVLADAAGIVLAGGLVRVFGRGSHT